MEAKETRPLLPKGRQSGRACQSERQSGWWMSNCSLRDRPGVKQIAPTALWCSMKCSNTPQTKGRRMQSVRSAKAIDMNCQSWTQRQTYLPSSWWVPKIVRKRSSPSTMRCINSADYQGLHLESWNWWKRWCLPLKTARGGNKGKHQKWQQSPSQLMSDLQGAEPLGGGGEEPL